MVERRAEARARRRRSGRGGAEAGMFQAVDQREETVQCFGNVEKGDFFEEFGEDKTAFGPAFAFHESGLPQGDGDAADELFGDTLRGGDFLDEVRAIRLQRRSRRSLLPDHFSLQPGPPVRAIQYTPNLPPKTTLTLDVDAHSLM